jgi:3-phenylpropionate/trans-cinnamate dioxygenase ferredoxin reductase subunit
MFGLFKKDKTPSGPRRVTIQPLGTTLDHQGDDSILTLALEQGIAFPHNCRVGGCASCKCQLLEGEVTELTDKSYLLSPEEMEANYILGCQSIPRGDVVVRVDGLEPGATAAAITKTTATITAQRALTHDIVELSMTLEQDMDYLAGQYAELTLPAELGSGVRSYSFAQAPSKRAGNSDLVFHVRKVPNGAFTEWLHAADRTGTALEIAGPYGDFHLREAGAPLLAIAGGSGMAPLKALLEQAERDQVSADVLYLFGARTQADLYCLDEMSALAKSWHGEFRFVPVLSAEPDGSDWQGRRGLVIEHIDELLGDQLAQQHVYMCGPPPMIDAAEAALTRAGVEAGNIHYDKFLDSSHSA